MTYAPDAKSLTSDDLNTPDKALPALLAQTGVWVIKVGSAMVTDNGTTLDRITINQWAYQIAQLRAAQKQVILVSSGAIAVGIQKLHWDKKPSALPEQQAAAAVGQMTLARVYEEIFQNYGIQTAQVLLTHEDAADRKRYLNIKSTLLALLKNDILPIVNENDTVSFDEIRFGDNDNLGALLANLTQAQLYVILTDQAGIYDADPRRVTHANLVTHARANDKTLDGYIGRSQSALGSGGMQTKLDAARRAANSNTATLIAHGKQQNVLSDLLHGKVHGTWLSPDGAVRGKKQWLAGQLKTKGFVTIDAGATKALLQEGKSLLPSGVTQVSGDFARGEVIDIQDSEQRVIARGISHYSSEETQQVKGLNSQKMLETLGYLLETELIHRDNLVLL